MMIAERPLRVSQPESGTTERRVAPGNLTAAVAANWKLATGDRKLPLASPLPLPPSPGRAVDLFAGDPPLKLSEMAVNQSGDVYALLDKRTQATTKDGKPYFRVEFRDAVRTVTVMVWHGTPHFADCESKWEEGVFYKLRGRYFENQYGPNLELDRIRAIDQTDTEAGFRESDYLPSSRFDPEVMWGELHAIFEEHISEEPLRELIKQVFATHSEAARAFPAASRNHHAYRHGYLEHTLSVTKTAVHLADKYLAYYPGMDPPLSKSLVVAGAAVHDIGKVRELDGRPTGANYTAEGRLVGHILIGRDLIREAARDVPNLNPDTLLRLEHIIISHQNLPEWGSPIAPHTPEALLVHYCDDIDAKYHMLAALLEQPNTDGDEFTSRRNPMGRMIYRGGAKQPTD